jgi:hypothetical protein
MTDRHPDGQNGLRFAARCAAVLPALWLALLLLALPFSGGHPPLASLVLIVPGSVSLTGRAVNALMGEPAASGLPLTVLVLGTLVELGFVGVVAGVGARSLLDGNARRLSAWLGCALIYVACHVFVDRVFTSRAVTGAVLSGGSPHLRHAALQRIARDRDRSYRDVLLTALEKGSEPDVDEDIIAALTWLEDGGFWHIYATSPRGSRWGLSFLSKVLCDLSNKSADLQRVPDVDFTRLTESFASLNRLVFERMVAELPDRPELLKPIFGISLDNPELGRSQVDRLFELLQRPSIAKCVHLPMSFRAEWTDPSHPRHRLYELATVTCQNFTKADLNLWLSHSESAEVRGPARLQGGALCQFIIDTEGMDRKGRFR